MGRRAEAVGLQLIDADKGNITLAAINALKQGRILITECDEFDEWRPDPNRESHLLNCRLYQTGPSTSCRNAPGHKSSRL
jgi:Kdo2-lipid IVA lauroyltransferase/acyltransferase